jgi:hypothetical protein
VSVARRRVRWPVGVLALAALIAGCGSGPAASGPASRPAVASIGSPALATSTTSAAGTGWAVVQLGGSADPLDNFWELFVRPANAGTWKLATPAGAASNGGLVMAASGANSLVAAFLPSQKLTFSPFAATTDGGAQWSQNALLSPGFRAVPYALGAGSRGQLLALTHAGDVKSSTNAGATWQTIATQRTLAGSPAARACGVESLTGAAWTPAGSPLVGASCDKPGTVGIFTLSAGAWRRSGLALPSSLSRDAVAVIGLATTGQRTTAVLAARSPTGISVLAGWSADGGTTWRVSPALTTGTVGQPSVSIWADSSAALVVRSQGATIGWEATAWRTLPRLPAQTATLAAGSGGQPQALAVDKSALTAWQLAVGGGRWTMTQIVRVPVPYGSSG